MSSKIFRRDVGLVVDLKIAIRCIESDGKGEKNSMHLAIMDQKQILPPAHGHSYQNLLASLNNTLNESSISKQNSSVQIVTSIRKSMLLTAHIAR